MGLTELEERMDGRGRIGGPTTSKVYDSVSNQETAMKENISLKK